MLTKFRMYSLGSEDSRTEKKQRQPSSSLRFLCRVVADNVVRKNAEVYSSSAASSWEHFWLGSGIGNHNAGGGCLLWRRAVPDTANLGCLQSTGRASDSL